MLKTYLMLGFRDNNAFLLRSLTFLHPNKTPPTVMRPVGGVVSTVHYIQELTYSLCAHRLERREGVADCDRHRPTIMCIDRRDLQPW